LVRFASREDDANKPVLEVQCQVSEIDAEADTYVWDGSPSTNYGTSQELLVKDGTPGYDRISYLRFPLADMSGPAASVTLRIKVAALGGEGSGPRTVQIRRLAHADSWPETGTWWNNRPPSSGTLIATIDAQPAGEVFNIDVTDYVNGQYSGDGKVSFVLVQPLGVGKLVKFASREAPAVGDRPTLVIE
jgi:hypothetical protein